MKYKKGFTLIELLAVILILGIISLIAIPTVNKIIEQTRKGAAEQSVNTYVEEIEKQIIMKQFEDDNILDDGEYKIPLLNKYGINTGVTPDDGWVVIKDGKVESYYVVIDGYVISSTGVSESADKLYLDHDVYLLDLADTILLESGDIDTENGDLIEHRRRVRTKDFHEIKLDKYDITIQTDFELLIYEYDKDFNYIKFITFDKNDVYKPSRNASYFKVVLKASTWDIEKTLSFGQWYERLSKGLKAKVSFGDLEKVNFLNNNISVSVSKNSTAQELQNALINDSKDLSIFHWNALVSNGIYTIPKSILNLEKRKTYYVSANGDDNNSGLSTKYPKKTLEQFSGINNINIMIESGFTYNVSSGFNVGSGVTIASYGNGNRPILDFYRELNVSFSKVDGYDNLYVTSLKNFKDIYKGTGGKEDCNIGQLVIDGEVNWKRKVYDSSSDFSYEMLTTNKDEKSWAIDTKNANLYIYTSSNPNKMKFRYAPPITGLSSKGTSNIVVQGIEITGAGCHGINFTNTTNVKIDGCSFKYIGGSILTSAGTRYGNAIQIFNSASNVVVSNNIANWIFDTCYTNQGSDTSMLLKDVLFKNNIGARAQWGIEIWGGGSKEFENIEYTHNLLYKMGDITNINTKMQCSSSGHLYGEVDTNNYISYRYGYTYHQAANLAIWFPTLSYQPSINNNIFWGTNRYLVIGTWHEESIDYYNLKNNLFYEDYYLSYNTTPALYKFKVSSNKYIANLSEITSNTTNMESIHKRGTYDNKEELKQMKNFIENIIK